MTHNNNNNKTVSFWSDFYRTISKKWRHNEKKNKKKTNVQKTFDNKDVLQELTTKRKTVNIVN